MMMPLMSIKLHKQLHSGYLMDMLILQYLMHALVDYYSMLNESEYILFIFPFHSNFFLPSYVPCKSSFILSPVLFCSDFLVWRSTRGIPKGQSYSRKRFSFFVFLWISSSLFFLFYVFPCTLSSLLLYYPPFSLLISIIPYLFSLFFSLCFSFLFFFWFVWLTRTDSWNRARRYVHYLQQHWCYSSAEGSVWTLCWVIYKGMSLFCYMFIFKLLFV